MDIPSEVGPVRLLTELRLIRRADYQGSLGNRNRCIQRQVSELGRSSVALTSASSRALLCPKRSNSF